MVKIVVTDFSEGMEMNELHLTLFHNNIAKLLNTEDTYDEDFVCSSLLQLQILQLTYNAKRNTVISY